MHNRMRKTLCIMLNNAFHAIHEVYTEAHTRLFFFVMCTFKFLQILHNIMAPLSACPSGTPKIPGINYPILLLLLLLYLSAHVQRTKQALGIAPHEALFKKKKHTQESLLRHYKKLLTVTQIPPLLAHCILYIFSLLYLPLSISRFQCAAVLSLLLA